MNATFTKMENKTFDPMKNFLISLSLLAILTLACNAETLPGYTVPGGTYTATPAGATAKNVGTPQSILAAPISTQTQVPTYTPNYQATSEIAEDNAKRAIETSQAANIVVAQFTAEYNAGEVEKQVAHDNAAQAESQAQIISVNSTASFAPTSIALTATAGVVTSTAQSIQLTAASDRQHAVEKAPTTIYALTQSNMAEETIRSNNMVKIAGAAFIAVMSIYVVIRLVALLLSGGSATRPNPEAAGPVDLNELDKDIIPFEASEESEDKLLRVFPDIPVPLHILLQIADGIIEESKTLVFRDWLGTDVYKYMKDFRDFMHINRMTKRNRGGEPDLIKKGEQFLAFAHANNTPPPPYRCKA